MKTFAIDVDGVLADLITNWLRWYNVEYNDHLIPEDITAWETDRFVKPECGKKIYTYLDDPKLYDEVLPHRDALKAINVLKSLGHRVVYPTTSPLASSGRKFYWLEQYGFIQDKKDYIETSDKSLIRADALVDDYYKNLDGFVGIKILLAQPWNADKKDNKNYLHAYTWGDVLRYCLGEL
jgi:5'-nucleotidase